eukprot:1883879-Pyramimonas_sp.AAC.1
MRSRRDRGCCKIFIAPPAPDITRSPGRHIRQGVSGPGYSNNACWDMRCWRRRRGPRHLRQRRSAARAML